MTKAERLQRFIERGGAISPEMVRNGRRTHEPTKSTEVRRVGLAAQHLVAADILLHGYDCSISAELLAYDLIADINGLRRVQVKCRATAEYRGARSTMPAYQFQQLKPDACDLFAFVILPARSILYRHAGTITANFISLLPHDFDTERDTFLQATQYWRSAKQAHHRRRQRNDEMSNIGAVRSRSRSPSVCDELS